MNFFHFFCSFFFLMGLLLQSPDGPFQGDKASIIQWVSRPPLFIPAEETGISIRTCPLLRTCIMLSVHGHDRSWNDKASEPRAGRWVQAEFEPANLRTPFSVYRPEERGRFTGHGPHGTWNCYRASWRGHCNVTGKTASCGELWKSAHTHRLITVLPVSIIF